MLKKRLGIEAIEADWEERGDYIYAYYKIPPTLIIPEGCERIGYAAFEDWDKENKKLREVIIPESVKEIERDAFYACSNATIILRKPESKFEFIGYTAFYGCKDVKEEIRG